jgi:uncharacterized protein YqeY
MSDRLNRLICDIDTARRAGDAEGMRILQFLRSKVERIVKEGPERPATDEDVIQAVSRYRKEVDETREALAKAGRPTDKEDREIALVAAYLPRQLTHAELDAEIEKSLAGVVRDRKAMGVVMKHLNGGFKGRFDPKTTNPIIAAKLTA